MRIQYYGGPADGLIEDIPPKDLGPTRKVFIPTTTLTPYPPPEEPGDVKTAVYRLVKTSMGCRLVYVP